MSGTRETSRAQKQVTLITRGETKRRAEAEKGREKSEREKEWQRDR